MSEEEAVVVPVSLNIEDVGKNIKSSKKRFTWVLKIKSKPYTFVLDASMLSGKTKLTCNDKVLVMTEEQPTVAFQHSLSLEGHKVTILSVSESFELRVDNRAFTHLLNQEKTNKEFAQTREHCQDFVLDSALSSGAEKKKIKLKIGSMGTQAKKGSSGSQSENWGSLVGAEEGQGEFPSCFPDSQPIDPNRVSMKKQKQTMSSTLEPQHCSEQQSLPPSREHSSATIAAQEQDISTMQQMFQTISPGLQEAPRTQAQEHSNSPVGPIHSEEFVTMQLMFRTQNPAQGSPVGQAANTSTCAVSVSEQPLPLGEFSTMQNLFATNVAQSIAKQIKCQENPCSQSSDQNSQSQQQTREEKDIRSLQPVTKLDQQFDPQNFSTLQQMFATNNLTQINDPSCQSFTAKQKQIQCPIPMDKSPASEQMSQDHAGLGFDSSDFATMANLFKTVNLSQSQIPSQDLSSNPIDLKTETPCEPLSNVLNTTENHISKQECEIKASDFNTMQNMFQTNQLPLSPQAFSQNIQPNKENF